MSGLDFNAKDNVEVDEMIARYQNQVDEALTRQVTLCGQQKCKNSVQGQPDVDCTGTAKWGIDKDECKYFYKQTG